MRILRIQAEGLPLYKKPFDISFYAVQRVQNCHLQSVHNLFGNIYINTVEALAGINASGKTTALETISFTSMLLSAAPLSSNFVPKILAENLPFDERDDSYKETRWRQRDTDLVREVVEKKCYQ